MFRLNWNKKKTNRNSLIGNIFIYFFRKFRVCQFFRFFFGFFGLFRNSLFRLFRFYTETESLDVSIELKQTEDPPKQFKTEYNWVFFRKFRVVSVCFSLLRKFCLFRLFQYRFETPKQTEIFSFWFHDTNQNKPETDLVLVCFGSNWNLFLFVSSTP